MYCSFELPKRTVLQGFWLFRYCFFKKILIARFTERYYYWKNKHEKIYIWSHFLKCLGFARGCQFLEDDRRPRETVLLNVGSNQYI